MLSQLLIVATALLLSASNASLLSHREYAATFSNWMSAGHRTYTADELMSKFAVFKANHYYVSRHNEEFKAGRKTFELGMNDNADLTLTEYRKKLGLRSTKAPTAAGLALGKSLHGNHSITASSTGKDWRGTPFLGPVKNQGHCGSCWSFAGTAVLQSAWAVKSGSLESFSEQQLIDCVNNGESTCDVGGIIAESWEYVLGGARPMTEGSYPYTGESGSGCKYDAEKASAAVFTNSVNIPEDDEAALANALDTVPAIAVAIDASTQDFQLYKSGVFTSDQCGNGFENLDHAVTVVGYGTDEASGEDYWIVQNSWDVSYGEEGYIRMRRNHNNMCGVAKDASYVLA
jgi:hypothetical protein